MRRNGGVDHRRISFGLNLRQGQRSPVRAGSLIPSSWLGPQGLDECSDNARREPEHIDDPEVLQTSFQAGLAKQVLWDVEASGCLRRSEQSVLAGLLERNLFDRRRQVADLSVAKTRSDRDSLTFPRLDGSCVA